MLRILLILTAVLCTTCTVAIAATPPDILQRLVKDDQTAQWTIQYDAGSVALTSLEIGLDKLRSKQGIYLVQWDDASRTLSFISDRGVGYQDVITVLTGANLMPSTEAFRAFLSTNPE